MKIIKFKDLQKSPDTSSKTIITGTGMLLEGEIPPCSVCGASPAAL